MHLRSVTGPTSSSGLPRSLGGQPSTAPTYEPQDARGAGGVQPHHPVGEEREERWRQHAHWHHIEEHHRCEVGSWGRDMVQRAGCAGLGSVPIRDRQMLHLARSNVRLFPGNRMAAGVQECTLFSRQRQA